MYQNAPRPGRYSKWRKTSQGMGKEETGIEISGLPISKGGCLRQQITWLRCDWRTEPDSTIRLEALPKSGVFGCGGQLP